MIKARAWPVRAMYMLIAAALVISLLITAAPAQKVSGAPAAEVEAKWQRVTTPSEKDWVLAARSWVVDLAVGDEGDVAYAAVRKRSIDIDGTGKETCDSVNYYLLKSTDGAATWKDITKALEKLLDIAGGDYIDELLAVACDWEDSDFVAVALWWWDQSASSYYLHVFISKDGGSTFKDTGEVEDGGNYLSQVFAFEVSPKVGDFRDIAIGGTGGSPLFRCQAYGDWSTGWEDATASPKYGGWLPCNAVVDIKFAPSWKNDKTILVATPVDGTPDILYLQCGTWGTSKGWNLDSTLSINAVPVTPTTGLGIPTDIPWGSLRGATAGINTPLDYSGRNSDSRYVWVNVNYVDSSGNVGRIFLVIDTTVVLVGRQIQDEPWLTNVSYLGTIDEGMAIAGLLGNGDGGWADCCAGVQVYRNDGIADMDICCINWKKACKPPTGRNAMAAFYVSQDKAYAVALGSVHAYDESAWSVSVDLAGSPTGDVWNQLSLIDTHISFLSDVAVSPDCNKTILASVNLDERQWGCGCDSVWLYASNKLDEAPEYTGKWIRTWCGKLWGYDKGYWEWGLLRLPPASEETTGDTVYLVDRFTDTVYWNELETWGCWDSGTAEVEHIVDLAVKDKETIYALDINGDVSMSDDYALGWLEAVDSKIDEDGWTIAVWGDDVLVGSMDGEVSHSADGGETFIKLKDVPVDIDADINLVTVAFDSYFDQNDTIYAAVAGFGEPDMSGGYMTSGGIYRLALDAEEEDESEIDWKDLKATPTRLQLDLNTVDPCEDVGIAYTGLVLDRPNPGNPKTSKDTGGVLYASYISMNLVASNVTAMWAEIETTSGAARCLTPAEEVCCGETNWDYLIKGLTRTPSFEIPGDPPFTIEGILANQLFVMMPDAIKICGCLTADSNSKLFAIGFDFPEMMEMRCGDTQWGYDQLKGKWGTVWMFEDCYAKKGVDTTYPANKSTMPADPCYCWNAPFSLKWDRLCDACDYDIQIALDDKFTEVVFDSRDLCDSGLVCELCPYSPSNAANPSFFVDQNELMCEVTYYWRVRAVVAETGQVIHSWWSDEQSFTVAPGPQAGLKLISPEEGATNVVRTNVGFTWSKIASADKYTWVLSKNADLSAPVETKTLTGTSTAPPATACTYTGTLTYDTTYYWQVKAYKDGSTEAIATSNTGTFRTVAETPPPPVEKPETTPFWVWVVIAIGAVLVIVVIVLIFRTRRV